MGLPPGQTDNLLSIVTAMRSYFEGILHTLIIFNCCTCRKSQRVTLSGLPFECGAEGNLVFQTYALKPSFDRRCVIEMASVATLESIPKEIMTME